MVSLQAPPRETCILEETAEIEVAPLPIETERCATRVVLGMPPSECRGTYERELRRHNFDVVTAGDGLHCLESIRENEPDVLVIEPDLLWGGGDGVLSIVGDEPELARIPVMLIIPDLVHPSAQVMAPFPVQDCALQPLNPSWFVARVQRLARGH